MAESIIPIRSWSSERWSDMPKVTGRFCSLQSQIIKGKGSGIRHPAFQSQSDSYNCVTGLRGSGSTMIPSPSLLQGTPPTLWPMAPAFLWPPEPALLLPWQQFRSDRVPWEPSQPKLNLVKLPAPSSLVWDNLETWVHWLLEFSQHHEALGVHSGNLLDNKHFIGLPSSSCFPISFLLPWDLLLNKSFALTALPLILRVCFWRTWTKTVTIDRSLNFSGTLSFLICKKRICILHTYLTGL